MPIFKRIGGGVHGFFWEGVEHVIERGGLTPDVPIEALGSQALNYAPVEPGEAPESPPGEAAPSGGEESPSGEEDSEAEQFTVSQPPSEAQMKRQALMSGAPEIAIVELEPNGWYIVEPDSGKQINDTPLSFEEAQRLLVEYRKMPDDRSV